MLELSPSSLDQMKEMNFVGPLQGKGEPASPLQWSSCPRPPPTSSPAGQWLLKTIIISVLDFWVRSLHIRIHKILSFSRVSRKTWLPQHWETDHWHQHWQAYQPYEQSPNPSKWRMPLICQIEGWGVIWWDNATVHLRSIAWESVLYFKMTQRTRCLIGSTWVHFSPAKQPSWRSTPSPPSSWCC